MDAQTVNVFTWLLGICITGFLFLAGWIIKLNTMMQKRVTFEWIEDSFEIRIRKEMKVLEDKVMRFTTSMQKIENILTSELGSDSHHGSLKITINEIKDSIKTMNHTVIGSVDKRGLITRVSDLEDRNNRIHE